MAFPIINSREDLDALKGTQEYADFIDYIKGSMTRKVNSRCIPGELQPRGLRRSRD